MPSYLILVNLKPKSIYFCKLFCRKSCEFKIFAIPLQTLLRNNETSSKTGYDWMKKALRRSSLKRFT